MSTAPTNPGRTSDGAMQDRIVSHMNADHAGSIILYLQYYNQLPKRLTQNARLDSITLDHMILTCNAGRLLVPFKPPMASYMEARERLVSMQKECLAGLGLSGIVVKEYRLPNRAYQWFFMVAVPICFLTLPFRSSILPESNSLVYKFWSLGGLFPSFARFTHTMAPWALLVMGVLHPLEAYLMADTKLRRHQVEIFSPLWWKWTLDTFIEGFGGFNRFDEVVREIEEKEKAKKH